MNRVISVPWESTGLVVIKSKSITEKGFFRTMKRKTLLFLAFLKLL